MKILPVVIKEAKEKYNNFFIELYTLTLTTGIVRLCNCDKVIQFGGNDYQPVPVQRGSIKSTVDSKIDNVELKIADTDLSKVAALVGGFDFRGCYCEIDRIVYPESLENSDIVMMVFYGYLDNPAYSNGEFTVQVKASLPYTNKPSRVTQYHCNSIFGDAECQANKGLRDITINTETSTASKIIVTTDMFDVPEGYYKNGLLTIGYETKMIQRDYYDGLSQRILQTSYPFLGDLVQNAKVQRNCDKTIETCRLYGNEIHYSGFLSVPKEYRLG